MKLKPLIIALFFSSFAAAQTNTADSLRQQLYAAKTDTGKYIILNRLTNYYSAINADSAIGYGKLLVEFAKKISLPIAEVYAQQMLGYAYYYNGDYVNAQRSTSKAFEVIDRQVLSDDKVPAYFMAYTGFPDSCNITGVTKRLRYRVHLLQGSIYLKTERGLKAEQEFIESRNFYSTIKTAVNGLQISLIYLSQTSLAIGKYEQGVQYGLEAYKISEKNKLRRSVTSSFLAANYLKLNKIAEAKKYLYIALVVLKDGKEIKDSVSIGLFYSTHDFVYPYTYLAETHLAVKQYDSALWYAHKGLIFTQSKGFKTDVFPLDTLLSVIHLSAGNTDSAYYYLKAANVLKDQLYSGQKAQELQNILDAEKEQKAELAAAATAYKNKLQLYGFLGGILFLLITAFVLLRSNRLQKRAYLLQQSQKAEIEKTLVDLKNTQAQLIQSEKMASLGELTAGIAHEIQNPLNFVNNFSEVSNELIDEMKEELVTGNLKEATAIADDLKENLIKINHHGKRADAIVKGMLQHSRSSSGQKELTDLNALCDEYLRLAYHGYRSKDKSFNAEFETYLDPSLPKIKVISQDIGRVVLNLINNAFYAVNEKAKQIQSANPSSANPESYLPKVTVSTKHTGDKIEITVADNGNGIPTSVINKIFQPFFTTKPTGQGTGLGLSLSYDIITKGHQGALEVVTKESVGTKLIISLPEK